MTFLAPTRLWLLTAVLALIIAYTLAQRRRHRYTLRFTNLALLEQVAPNRPGWRRHLPAALFLATLTLLVGAWARPADTVKVPRERATIMLALDVSGSMGATDIAPTRLEAAKTAAQQFIRAMPARFNVGLVSFSGTATVLNSPTQDHQAVIDSISQLQRDGATAIGDAVLACLQAIRSFDTRSAADPPPAAIVLMSDGANTTGHPLDEAIHAAAAAHVPVSTIAYGTDTGYILQDGQRVLVQPDRAAMRALADGTGGHAYQADSDVRLDQVYRAIGTSLGYRSVHKEITARWVGAALITALLAGGLSLAWFSRLP